MEGLGGGEENGSVTPNPKRVYVKPPYVCKLDIEIAVPIKVQFEVTTDDPKKTGYDIII